VSNSVRSLGSGRGVDAATRPGAGHQADAGAADGKFATAMTLAIGAIGGGAPTPGDGADPDGGLARQGHRGNGQVTVAAGEAGNASGDDPATASAQPADGVAVSPAVARTGPSPTEIVALLQSRNGKLATAANTRTPVPAAVSVVAAASTEVPPGPAGNVKPRRQSADAVPVPGQSASPTALADDDTDTLIDATSVPTSSPPTAPIAKDGVARHESVAAVSAPRSHGQSRAMPGLSAKSAATSGSNIDGSLSPDNGAAAPSPSMPARTAIPANLVAAVPPGGAAPPSPSMPAQIVIPANLVAGVPPNGPPATVLQRQSPSAIAAPSPPGASDRFGGRMRVGDDSIAIARAADPGDPTSPPTDTPGVADSDAPPGAISRSSAGGSPAATIRVTPVRLDGNARPIPRGADPTVPTDSASLPPAAPGVAAADPGQDPVLPSGPSGLAAASGWLAVQPDADAQPGDGVDTDPGDPPPTLAAAADRRDDTPLAPTPIATANGSAIPMAAFNAAWSGAAANGPRTPNQTIVAAVDGTAGVSAPTPSGAAPAAVTVTANDQANSGAGTATSLGTAVANHVMSMLSSGRQEATLQLQPPQLGELTIHVAVQGRDVSTWFGAAQPQVQLAVNQALDQLRADLAGAGLNLANAWVGADASSMRQQSFAAAAVPTRRPGFRAPSADGAAAENTEVRRSSGVSIYV
jgi:hypothetical protein